MKRQGIIAKEIMHMNHSLQYSLWFVEEGEEYPVTFKAF